MRLNIQWPSLTDTNRDEWLRDVITKLRVAVDNAHLGFGDGLVADNIYGAWASYTTNAIANTADSITHNLGVVPIGWLDVKKSAAGILYDGGVAWTTSTISLKCSAAAVDVVIFILGASNVNF